VHFGSARHTNIKPQGLVDEFWSWPAEDKVFANRPHLGMAEWVRRFFKELINIHAEPFCQFLHRGNGRVGKEAFQLGKIRLRQSALGGKLALSEVPIKS
jgi:hypothetical protein